MPILITPRMQEAAMTSTQSPSPNSGHLSHATRGAEAPPLHTRFEEEGYGEEQDLLLRP